MRAPDHRPAAVDATPQQVAEATRERMSRDDHASRMLGMNVLAIAPGRCTIEMVVRGDMLNGHGSCHGGLITTLADSAFAFACNSYNEISVAAGFDVNLVAAAFEGDCLTAHAVEVAKTGRTGVYDIDVTNQKGQRIATFRGRSYTMKGKPLIEGLPMGKPR
jgi:acyl-CoA thioesterase